MYRKDDQENRKQNKLIFKLFTQNERKKKKKIFGLFNFSRLQTSDY